MVFIPALILLLGLVLYWSKLSRKTSAQLFAKDIPGPRSYPLIGSAHLFLGSDERTFSVINELFRKYGSFFKLSLGPKSFLCLSDPELIQQALTSSACQDKAFFYRFMELDYGLISSRYTDWKLYRKSLNPAFNQRILISFISIFNRCSEVMVARMAKEADRRQPFDVLHYTAQCALEMVFASSLKSDITDNAQLHEACEAIQKMCTIMSSRMFNVLLYSDLLFTLTHKYHELQKLKVKVDRVVNPILYGRREKLSKQRLDNAHSEDEEHYRKPMVFLDQLLHMQRGGQDLEIQEIENHLNNIIAAGSDTTASQVAFILLMLAMHPEVQERVYEEIVSIYGSAAPDLSYETILAQTYLDQVIKETMRMYPVGPIIGRETIETVKLGDVIVPPGVTLLINILTVHRNKELWGDRAHVFDPDRFDPAQYDAKKRHPFSYIPFGGGPRNCIGYRYGMLAMKIMVTQVLRKYQLSTPLTPSDSLRPFFAITLKVGTGHSICVKRRASVSL